MKDSSMKAPSTLNKRYFHALVLVGSVMVFASQANAAYTVVATVGDSATVNGVTFLAVNSASGGSGNLDPFLAIGAASKDVVEGFNNDQAQTPLDTNNAKTSSLLLSAVPLVSGKREFLLDINQNSGGTPDGQTISLEVFKVYLSSNPSITTLADLNNPANAALVTDLGTTQLILSNHENGSGKFDYVITIDNALFTAQTGTYVYFYAKFGNESDATVGGVTYNLKNNDGFEEFGVRSGTTPNPVPAPSSAIAALSGLAFLGLIGVARYRRRPEAILAA
jgi:hypothetical protein